MPLTLKYEGEYIYSITVVSTLVSPMVEWTVFFFCPQIIGQLYVGGRVVPYFVVCFT